MRIRPTLGLLTVLLLLVGGTGIYLVDRHQKNGAIDRAEAEAARLHDVLDSFQAEITERLSAVDLQAEPHQGAELAEELRMGLPTAQDVPEYGSERSADFREALQRRAALQERLDVAADVLEEWAVGAPFAAAAQQALDADLPQRVVGGPVASGAPVRDELIPLMNQIRSEFDAVEVPPGQEGLAAGVDAALQHVVDEAEAAAVELDAGRSASFAYGTQYRDALRPVAEYEASLRQRVESALAALALPSAEQGEAVPEQVPVEPVFLLATVR
ncbi:hypothetical protein BHE97_05855 [Aeromicrobium sp. PE09-221]|uniref:hypothetical protein n=1 Tax=Aeromicrobium sp. PE09-221 TaxID=1898043 RepID=UPI000B3EC6CA|nr:hypothetical protein [Aeromicrobium sp. PE09-221]OUZ11357.1 hypothetical protein BHE97_05855 [Aeromicrobium sp. PE09-221]